MVHSNPKMSLRIIDGLDICTYREKIQLSCSLTECIKDYRNISMRYKNIRNI